MNIEEILKKYIHITLKSNDIHFITIRGSPGIGKSYIVAETLKELSLEEDVHYKILSGYVTPKKLFEILKRTKMLEKPKLIVMDDLDSIFNNKTSTSILKGALINFNNKRIVSYQSTRGEQEEQSFDFDGKLILIVNNIPRSINIEPLLDRGIYFSFDSDTETLVNYIEQNVLPKFDLGSNEIREIWEKVKRFTNSPNFSIRSLNRAVSFYKHDKDNWYKLFTKSLKR